MSTAYNISINSVAGRSDKSEFISLPAKIYKSSPQWVMPLNKLARHEIDLKKNPFWKHADGILFLAKKNGETVGRISAQIDHNFNNFHNSKIGFFGFFECINDTAVSSALFSAAENWLAKRGMKKIQGPFSPSINSDCGFMTEGFDQPHIFSTVYSMPYYPALAENFGFKKIKNFFAFKKSEDSPTPAIFYKIAARLKNQKNFSIRPFNENDLENEVKIIVDLFNECWCDNWGFSPLTYDELYEVLRNLKLFKNKSVALLAFSNNTLAGVCVTIPDANELFAGLNGKLGIRGLFRVLFCQDKITRCRNVILGVRKEYRGTGLPVLLFCESEPFVRKNFKQIEFSWTLDDNIMVNNFIKRVGAELYKRYCIMEKTI